MPKRSSWFWLVGSGNKRAKIWVGSGSSNAKGCPGLTLDPCRILDIVGIRIRQNYPRNT